ncbi:hypothetical protein K435DRAFT_790557, partial [Dendrothele bispora CBS 962.96]
MAKKKKTQLKPVTRGFATTSVPKKVVEAEPVEEETLVATTSSAGEIQNAASDAQVSDAAGVVEGVDGSLDPGQAEERALQGIVDKFQEKVEREIVRAVKDFFWKGRRQLDEGEDKALLKLAVTYGTLRRLGFSEKTVEECLKAINGVDLDEAYDW